MKKKTKYLGIYIFSLLCLVYPFYTLIQEKKHSTMLLTILLIALATVGLRKLLRETDEENNKEKN